MEKNTKIILGISGAALGVLLLVASMMGRGMGDRGTMMGGGMMGGGFSGMLLMLLFWAIVVALLVTLFTWVLNQRQRR
jgi:uncharacterized membrane protein